MKFSGKVGNGPMNKFLNFGGNPNQKSGYISGYGIRNPETDPTTDQGPDPYRDTGKTCLGGGMHCPGASGSFIYFLMNMNPNAMFNITFGHYNYVTH